MDADRARRLLTEELAQLDERARFAAETVEETAVPEEQAGQLTQHPADAATDTATAQDALLLEDTVGNQRRAVEDALARLEAGGFGRCAVCDRDIDDERLEARPEVRTCREHADTPVLT